MNSGKRFEQNFKNSVPSNAFYYRFRDGTAGRDKGENVRFQASNMCDCMIFRNGKLILAELKSHKGKSIPLSAFRENQIRQLKESDKFINVCPYIIVHFQDIEECYALDICHYEHFVESQERKSIPISFFRENGIRIDGQKKKVNTLYYLDSFISKA